MHPLQKWSISFAATVVAVAVAFLWLDQPIAFFSHGSLKQAPIFDRLTLLPEPLIPLSLLTLFALGFWALAGGTLQKPHHVALMCSASLIVAETLKSQLKYVFGRTWPETWINGNPSLIHDGVYGFNFFHGGQAYASFPSGHTTAVCAVVSVLWICYPRFRVLYGFTVAAVAIGLIGADYHFLSDIIAGGFIGTTTGWFTVLLCAGKAMKEEASSVGRPIGFLH
jgi:membrane-associated phospholipid phosphatase